MWLSTEPFHLLFLSRLEYPQSSVLGPILFLIFINDLTDSLENPLYLFADDYTVCRHIPHHFDSPSAASSHSSDLDKNHKLVKFSLSLTLTLSLSKRTVPQTLLCTFYTTVSNRFSHSNSWVSLSAMISLGQATFQNWLPKPDANWASSGVQSPSLAHLSSYPPSRLSPTA